MVERIHLHRNLERDKKEMMNKIYTVAGYIAVALSVCIFLYFIIYGI